MEDMTEEELEAYKEQVTTTLSARRSDDVQDLDSILSEKGELKSLAEETGELSASDAAIREQLFEITGEDGVLPGEKVNIGMSLTDSSFAGNEVSEATANFSFDEKGGKASRNGQSESGWRRTRKERGKPFVVAPHANQRRKRHRQKPMSAVPAAPTYPSGQPNAVFAAQNSVECLSAFIGLVIAVARPSLASFRRHDQSIGGLEMLAPATAWAS